MRKDQLMKRSKVELTTEVMHLEAQVSLLHSKLDDFDRYEANWVEQEELDMRERAIRADERSLHVTKLGFELDAERRINDTLQTVLRNTTKQRTTEDASPDRY